MLLSTIDLRPIINFCMDYAVIPSVIIGFMACSYGFYLLKKDGKLRADEILLMVTITLLIIPAICMFLFSFSIIIVPFTLIILLAYYSSRIFDIFEVKITKKNGEN